MEQLTHTAYFVQTKRIKPSLNTRLDKLLSIFEQANFISGSETTKDYALSVDDPELKETLDILRYAAADSETRKELDEEEYYQHAMQQMFGKQNEKMEKQAQEIATVKREAEDAKRKAEDAKREAEDAKRKAEDAERKAENAKRENDESTHNIVHELRKKGMSASEIARIVKRTEAEVEKM